MHAQNNLDLPPKFTRLISGAFGENGRNWLAVLPKLIDEIAEEWSLKVGKNFANLSYHYVAECVCADGSDAVLKIGVPNEHREFFTEVRTLQYYNGEGAVKLLRVDESRFAMLLERLMPGENLGKLCLKDDAKAVEIAAGLLKRMVRKAPENGDFNLLENWINKFKQAENSEFPRDTIKKAQSFYHELTSKNDQKLLLHGDFHHENMLSAGREPFLVIDPKGLIGNVGYDIGVFLNNHRNWLQHFAEWQEKLAHSVDQFSEVFKIEPDDVRKWAFIQMVLSAWWTFEENDKRWKSELRKAEVWQV